MNIEELKELAESDLLDKIVNFCEDNKLKFIKWNINDVILLRDNLNRINLTLILINDFFNALESLNDNLRDNTIELKNNNNFNDINLEINQLDYIYKAISNLIVDKNFMSVFKFIDFYKYKHKLSIAICELSDWINVLKSEAANKERIRLETEKAAARNNSDENKKDNCSCNAVSCQRCNLD